MIGDATESGLVRFVASRLLGNEDVDGFRNRYPKVKKNTLSSLSYEVVCVTTCQQVGFAFLFPRRPGPDSVSTGMRGQWSNDYGEQPVITRRPPFSLKGLASVGK